MRMEFLYEPILDNELIGMIIISFLVEQAFLLVIYSAHSHLLSINTSFSIQIQCC